MGCRSDYQAPTGIEIENSKVLALTEEVEIGQLPIWYGTGRDAKGYSSSSKATLDTATAILCDILKTKSATDIQKFSLELQMWWRDHQAADRKREEALEKEAKSLDGKILYTRFYEELETALFDLGYSLIEQASKNDFGVWRYEDVNYKVVKGSLIEHRNIQKDLEVKIFQFVKVG